MSVCAQLPTGSVGRGSRMDKYWDRTAEGPFNAVHSTKDTDQSSFWNMGKEQRV